MNAVIYLRASTDKQAASTDTQRTYCRRLCEQNGWHVAGEYVDEAVSGKSRDNRPELAKALDLVCRKEYVLVSYSLSRVARSTPDALNISEKINSAGANMAFVRDAIDTTTPIGRFMFTIIAGLAQLERELLSERTSDAMRRLQADGHVMSKRLPFGKMHDPSNPGRTTVCPSEESVIRVIRSFTPSWGPFQIAQKMAADGFVGRDGKPLSHSLVARIRRSAVW